MLRLVTGLLIGAAAAAPAWSQAYLGLAVGQAKFKNACGDAASVSCTTSDTSFKGLVGYQATPTLGFEAGYTDLGSVDASSGEHAQLTAFDFSGIISWPLGNRAALLARLGTYRGSMDVSGTPSSPPPTPTAGWLSGHIWNATFGCGASYEMSHNAGFRAEWQRLKNFGGAAGPKFNVDLFALSALLRF
jgi:hypothetical protein